MACDDVHNFVTEATAFLQSGHYSSGLGDAMPLAAANALGISLILITSVHDWPVVAITPETLLESVPVFLGLEDEHYSCLIETNQESIKNKENSTLQKSEKEVREPNFKPVYCRCGVNSKDNDRFFCSAKTITGSRKRKYSSRCICVKRHISCSKLCKCKNCGNGRVEVSSSMKKRKSTKKLFSKTKKQEVFMKSQEFLSMKELEPKRGPLTSLEYQILQCVILILGASNYSVSMATDIFNQCLKQIWTRLSINLPSRTKEEIKKAVEQINRKKKLFLKLKGVDRNS